MISPARTPHREDGWVLVSAIVLMAIMLTVGLAAFAFVDTGQKRSRESRERESALSLAEGALYAQGFALTKNWPNTNNALTGDCTSTAAIVAPAMIACSTSTRLAWCEKRPSTSSPFSITSSRATRAGGCSVVVTGAATCTYGRPSAPVRTSTTTSTSPMPTLPRQA